MQEKEEVTEFIYSSTLLKSNLEVFLLDNFILILHILGIYYVVSPMWLKSLYTFQVKLTKTKDENTKQYPICAVKCSSKEEAALLLLSLLLLENIWLQIL